MTVRSRKRANNRKRHALPKVKFATPMRPEAGILAQVATALRMVEAIPQVTIVILPPPTPDGILPRLLSGSNR